ncbi:MAG: glycosyltransferase [Planctomycetota bacterium]
MSGPAARGRPPRVLVASLRQLRPTPARCVNVELEDRILDMDEAELWSAPAPAALPVLAQRALHRAPRELPALRPLAGWAARRLGPCPLERDYELLFVTCQAPGDLYLLGPLEAWRRRCRLLVCMVDELWAETIPRRAGELSLLDQFDRVFLGCRGSVDGLAQRMRTPVEYLPPGVDALAFHPGDTPPRRGVDVYSLGRRSERTHGALRDHCRRRGWLYLYDTLRAREVLDARQHRALLADLIRRTRYFVANRAKADVPGQTRGQEELGFRFFEGAAGGAVLIGDPPRGEAFLEHFAWEDSVIPLEYGSGAAGALLDQLERQPERVERIRWRNVSNVLLRHDWACRWQRILESVGLAPSPRLLSRRAYLRDLSRDAVARARLEPSPA